MSNTWVTYGGMLNDGVPIDEHYDSLAKMAADQISNLHDRTCEDRDEATTVREMLKFHMARIQPTLIWTDIERIGFQTVDNVVSIGYGVPIQADRHGVEGLHLGLPSTIEDRPSQFIRFGETGFGPKPMMIIEFNVPRALWDEKGESWFQSIRDEDLRWVKRAVDAYHDAETRHLDGLVELIHRKVKDRYDFVRNLSLALTELPIPDDISGTSRSRSREFNDPGYRVHKRLLFGQQEGVCNGCEGNFHFEAMTVDHIVPRSKGGSHEFDNLQLLCDPCNGLKADGTMDDFRAALENQVDADPDC